MSESETATGRPSPPASCSTRRLAFETWARAETQMTLTPAPEGCVHPDYYSGTTQRAWEAWQEAYRQGYGQGEVDGHNEAVMED